MWISRKKWQDVRELPARVDALERGIFVRRIVYDQMSSLYGPGPGTIDTLERYATVKGQTIDVDTTLENHYGSIVTTKIDLAQVVKHLVRAARLVWHDASPGYLAAKDKK